MKKRKTIIVVISLIVCISIIAIGVMTRGERPFKDLKTEEIQEATVEIYLPYIVETLNEEEIEELVEILNRVVIYEQDSTYGEGNGQVVIYRITKTDGTELAVQASNPFVVIDGVGYDAKYEPCEALNKLANRVGGTRFQ